MNYALCGMSAWWWHLVNVLLHAACCALVARTGVLIARLQRPFAALAALLFAVHPIHTEAVSTKHITLAFADFLFGMIGDRFIVLALDYLISDRFDRTNSY